MTRAGGAPYDEESVTPPGPVLAPPSTAVRESFLAAVAEFRAEGRSDQTQSDQDLDAYGEGWDTPNGFVRLVAALRAEAHEDTPRLAGIVPQTTPWWTRGSDYLGRLDVRHRLTPSLLEDRRGRKLRFWVPT